MREGTGRTSRVETSVVRSVSRESEPKREWYEREPKAPSVVPFKKPKRTAREECEVRRQLYKKGRTIMAGSRHVLPKFESGDAGVIDDAFRVEQRITGDVGHVHQRQEWLVGRLEVRDLDDRGLGHVEKSVGDER